MIDDSKDGANRLEAVGARLNLFGFPPTEVGLAVIPRARAWRARRAASRFALFLILALVVVLIPPHVPWALGSLGTGLFLARRGWQERFTVASFSGRCPKCSTELHIGDGARLRFPHNIACEICHFEPVLEVDTHLFSRSGTAA